MQSEGIFTNCPMCSGQILKAAKTCLHCGEGLKISTASANSSATASKQILIKDFIFFSLITFGLYHIYWFYLNWSLLKRERDSRINPVLNTLCLIIPFYNFYMVYKCFKEINALVVEAGMKPYKYVEASYQYVFIALYALLPSVWSVLAILKFWPLIDVQKTINEYLARKEKAV